MYWDVSPGFKIRERAIVLKLSRFLSRQEGAEMLKSARNISSQSLEILYMMALHTMILQTCQFHQVCNNLLKLRLVASGCVDLWITDFDNQLAASQLTTCNRLVVNRLVVAGHAKASWYRLVDNKSVAIYKILRDLLRLVCLWLNVSIPPTPANLSPVTNLIFCLTFIDHRDTPLQIEDSHLPWRCFFIVKINIVSSNAGSVNIP